MKMIHTFLPFQLEISIPMLSFQNKNEQNMYQNKRRASNVRWAEQTSQVKQVKCTAGAGQISHTKTDASKIRKQSSRANKNGQTNQDNKTWLS